MPTKSILFICTGNRFRSLSAELLFKQYIQQNKLKNWKVNSAGTIAKHKNIDPKTIETLNNLGISKINHIPQKISAKLLSQHDVIVAMAQSHLDYLKKNFPSKHVILFNELYNREKSSILDIEDEIKDYKTNRPAVDKKIIKTVKEISQKIPQLFHNANERFYLFSDFVNGLKKHRNGYPFIILLETPKSIAFMSVDIPAKEDGHILIIPKKHYIDYAEIPAPVLSEITKTIQIIGQAIRKHHGGYNILLNNGSDAGQFIFHSHFHIIPRTYHDGIKIEDWNHQGISIEKFINLNKKLLKQIKTSSNE